MASRCLPADKVAGYVEFALSDHGGQTRVTMAPQHWTSSDLGSV